VDPVSITVDVPLLDSDALEGIVAVCVDSFDLELAPAAPTVLAGMADVRSSSIDLTGAWPGRVLVQCPQPLAVRMAGVLFQLDDDAVNEDDVVDTLAELANVIGGNVKSLLPAPSQLGLPSSPAGTLAGFTAAFAITAFAGADGLPIVVTVHPATA
jgi:chemotaxis protein CheX